MLDIQALHTLKQRLDATIHLDLQLIYEREIAQAEHFSLDSHGVFFCYILQHATVLYGFNPFLTKQPSILNTQRSVVNKLQYYVFRARQQALGIDVPTKHPSKDFHRKKILLAVQDILLMRHKKLALTSVTVFSKHFPKFFSPAHVRLLKDKKPLSIEQALPIYEQLYLLAQQLVHAPTKPRQLTLDGIFCEYLLPDNTQTDRALILCDGIPSQPLIS